MVYCPFCNWPYSSYGPISVTETELYRRLRPLAGSQGRGIAGVIEKHANNVYDTFTRNGTDTQPVHLFKAIFIRLVEITSSKDDVRKTVSQKNLVRDLAYRFSEDQIQEMLLDYLERIAA